jgi:hypothetical protein
MEKLSWPGKGAKRIVAPDVPAIHVFHPLNSSGRGARRSYAKTWLRVFGRA